MRTLLVITLLTPLLWAGPNVTSTASEGETAAAGPNLLVVDFNWRRQRREDSEPGASSFLSRPGDATSGGGTAPPSVASRQERETPDVEQTRALHRVEGHQTLSEAGAARSGRPYKYKYEVTVRNADARAVKAFYWATETPQSQPDRFSPRQFFCAADVNSGESREFKAESLAYLPKAGGPYRVKSAAGQVTINRIEYADGSVWQRPGWEGVGGVVPSTNEPTRTSVQGCVALRKRK